MNVKNVNSGIVVLIVDQILTEKTKKANHSIAPINQKKVFGKRISRILSVNWEVKHKAMFGRTNIKFTKRIIIIIINFLDFLFCKMYTE